MDINSLALYTHELRNQCLYMDAAFNIFNQSLENGAMTGVFFAAQGALTSASLVAGVLWPRGTRTRKRGEQLRAALQLPEKHALNDRRLINLWEGHDERLDAFITDTKGEQIAFDYIGRKIALGEAIKDSSLYRLYDPESHIFYYRGQSFHMQGIANAVMDVSQRVMALHDQLIPPPAQSEATA